MLIVGILGLEPKMTGPESVVLPITPYPNIYLLDEQLFVLICDCKGTTIF